MAAIEAIHLLLSYYGHEDEAIYLPNMVLATLEVGWMQKNRG